MRQNGSLSRDEEANVAAKEALKGAAVGASRYGLPSLLLSGAGQVLSPVYRGLTIQFKVFLVMSGMILGGMIEGDRRMRDYEAGMRIRKRIEKDTGVWREWEDLVERKGEAERVDAGNRKAEGR